MKGTEKILLLLCLLMGTAFAASGQKTYVVSVGVGAYENNWCNPLEFCANDAKGLSTFFNNHRDCDVFMLLNRNATRSHILRVLENSFSKAGPGDEIIFIYSGHGFDGGITCYNQNDVVYCSEIQNIMKKSRAGRKIMFLGSCHSGSFTKKYNSNDNNSNRRGGYRTSAGNVMLYVSSRANEFSWGSTTHTYSYFINRLLQGLKGSADKNGDRKVTARELFNYVNQKVMEDTDYKQHPQMYGKFDDDMVVVNLN